ncbi:MAG: hypothetical protein LBK47_01010 [Prevotellaceae bacterium]|nr:hypothetical protein [Prevotellaceae bacterium]
MRYKCDTKFTAKKARFSLVYNHRVRKLAATEKAPIHVEVYFSRTVRSHVDTNVAVEFCYWNARAKVLKKTHPNYIVLYQMLKQTVDSLEKFELSLINRGREGKGKRVVHCREVPKAVPRPAHRFPARNPQRAGLLPQAGGQKGGR